MKLIVQASWLSQVTHPRLVYFYVLKPKEYLSNSTPKIFTDSFKHFQNLNPSWNYSRIKSLARNKKGREFGLLWFYGFLLARTIPTIAIAMIMATVLPTMYISVGGRTVCDIGAGVAAAGSTAKLASEYDG